MLIFYPFVWSALKWNADFHSVPVSLHLQIAPVENDDSYDELKRDAKTCLSLMSQGLLYPQQIPLVLKVLHEVRPQPCQTHNRTTIQGRI